MQTETVKQTKTKMPVPQVEDTKGVATIPDQVVDSSSVLASDILIPKVLLMQGQSEFVAQRKAQLGDIVRSTNCEKLGGPESALEFIPLSSPETTWVIELEKNGKFEFKKTIPRNAMNNQMEWNFFADANGEEVSPGTPGAVKARRVQRLSCYALLPSDIEADMKEKEKVKNGEFPDFSKALMPVLLSFRSLSYRAGKELATFFKQAESYKQPAWKAVLKLSCHFEQNDKGTFYVFDVDRTKPVMVKKEHFETVAYWANVVKNTQLRVDEAPEEVEGTGSTQF